MKKVILSLAVLAAAMLVPRAGDAETESFRAGPISFKVEGAGKDAAMWKKVYDGRYYLVHEENKKRVALLLPAVQAAREAARRQKPAKIEFKLKANIDPDCEPEDIGGNGTIRLGRDRGDDKREALIRIPGVGDCGDIQGFTDLPLPAPPSKGGGPDKDP